MTMIRVDNDGQSIVSSNYWESDYAARGVFYLTSNSGAFRLLVPARASDWIAEMKTAREVIVSRGPWPAQRRDDALELLFDDDSDSPFALHIGLEQVDRVPQDTDQVPNWTFAVWGSGPKLLMERPAKYRRVATIPYLKPWRE